MERLRRYLNECIDDANKQSRIYRNVYDYQMENYYRGIHDTCINILGYIEDEKPKNSELKECEKKGYMTHQESGDDFENIFIMKSGGGAFVRVSYYNKDNSGFISDLSVDKNLRCSGIGGDLLKTAENIIHNNGKQFSMLKVKNYVWMHEWYERCGYSPLDHDEDFINMIKNLEK